MLEQVRPTSGAFTPSATITAGDVITPADFGQVVDCSASPFDLRPAADIIIKTINDRRAAVGPDTPIVVLMGETHIAPSHIMLQQLTARRLMQRGDDFTMNFEFPSNLAVLKAKENFGIRLAKNTTHLNLDAFMTLTPTSSPAAQASQMIYGLKTGLRSAFVDAALTDDQCVDTTDPVNRAVLETVLLSGNHRFHESPDPLTPLGMAVRNHVMVRNVYDHMARTGSNLAVVKTGIFHLYGNRMHGHLFGDSLTMLFAAAGATTIPVFCNKWDVIDYKIVIPLEAKNALAGSIVIEGLSGTWFHSAFNAIEGELAFLKKLQQESGNELEIFDIREHRDFYREQFRQAVMAGRETVFQKAKRFLGFAPS